MKFAELTSTQLAAVDRHHTVVVLPIAAVEQHGPAMPTGTDLFLCSAVAEAVEVHRPERVLLAPTLWLGASAHHLKFGATLDTGLNHYVATLCDLAGSLLKDGYLRLLILNGHGGNIDPMRMALRILQPEFPQALLAAGCYWDVASDLICETLAGEHKFVGHACEFETSMLLYLKPELVDAAQRKSAGPLIADNLDGLFLSRDMRQRTREGFTGRPDLATAEKGQRLFDGIVQRLVTTIDKLACEPLGQHYCEFMNLPVNDSTTV